MTNVYLKQISETLITIYLENIAIGKITLTKIEESTYNIYFETSLEYQNMHYTMQAIYSFCETFPFSKLYATISSNDKKSRHILTHNGFEIIQEENDQIHLEKTKQYCKPTILESSDKNKWIILAGGCFWGVEHVYQALYGVTNTICGYANGNGTIVNYASVCKGEGNYKEAVAICYDPTLLSLKTILDVYFMCIDPTEYQRQKEDIGKQYQTGIYYLQDGEEINSYLNIKKKEYSSFFVEFEKLNIFYKAEEYHQSYLDKHPNGYCHIPFSVMQYVKSLKSS